MHLEQWDTDTSDAKEVARAFEELVWTNMSIMTFVDSIRTRSSRMIPFAIIVFDEVGAKLLHASRYISVVPPLSARLRAAPFPDTSSFEVISGLVL
jgi:hypothetical protein